MVKLKERHVVEVQSMLNSFNEGLSLCLSLLIVVWEIYKCSVFVRVIRHKAKRYRIDAAN